MKQLIAFAAALTISLSVGAVVIEHKTPTILAQADTANQTSTTPSCAKDVWTETTNVSSGTFTVNAPGSCTPVNGQKMQLWINAVNVQTYSWNAIFAGGASLGLPTTSSSGSVWDYFAFEYNINSSKWVFVAYLPGVVVPLGAASGGTGEAGTVTGVPKANGSSAFTAAVAADISGLWSGTCNSTTFLRGDGSCQAAGGGTLTATYVGYGSAGNALTGTSNFAFVNGTSTATTGTYNATSTTASFQVGGTTFIAQPTTGTTIFGYGGNGYMTGTNDTLLGDVAGLNLTSGSYNVMVGVAGNITSGSSNIVVGYGTSGTSATNSGQIDIGDLLFWNKGSTAAPALSACGTGSPTVDAHGNNRSGTITMGGGALASCTMTFAGSGYATWNHCRVTPHATLAAFAYSYTLTTMTITATSETAAVVDYDCDGL